MSRSDPPIDSTIEIVTPENIAFHYRVAGPFRRFPAYLIDLGIRIAVLVVAAIVCSLLGVFLGGLSFAILIVGQFVLEWFYGGLFETFMNGQTPGKWLLGMRTLSRNGQPINGMQAVMRNLLRTIDLWPLVSIEVLNMPARLLYGESLPPKYLFPTCLIGLGAMMLTRRFQRLGDIVCGTMVVIEERKWLTGMAPLDDPRVVQLAAYLPADFRVSRSLGQALATYVERRKYFSVARRREIARHLAIPLLTRCQLPSDTSYDLLLCALYYRAFIADQKDDERQAAQWGKSPFSSSAAAGAALPGHSASSPWQAPGQSAPGAPVETPSNQVQP